MKQYDAKNIKNMALVGHAGAGKTSFAEAMLYTAKATDRLGKIADGNTVMDFDPEEKRRHATVSTAVASLEWKENKFNFVDAPGLFDFESGVCEALRAVETAVIVLSAKSGLSVGAEKAFAAATKENIKKVFFISKIDSETADYFKVVAALTDFYGSKICPVVFPHVVDRKVECYINIATGKAYKYSGGKMTETDMPDTNGKFEELKAVMTEAIAGADDALMEKFFEGEEFTQEEILNGLKAGLASGEIFPVYCGSGQENEGIDIFLNDMAEIAPSAADAAEEIATDKNGNEIKIKTDASGTLSAVVFKTIADPFVGKLSYFKVKTSKISPESAVVNARTGDSERISKVMFIRGAKLEDTPYVSAGDIGAVAKLGSVSTGDTLTDSANRVTLKGVSFPSPTYSVALYPTKKGEEEKIASGLGRLIDEDPSIKFEQKIETHELVLSGLGEQHVDVIISKLKSKFGVDVKQQTPKVAYRETIRKSCRVQGRHKKQSGGHGQFGDVWIEFSPCDSDSLVFEEKIFGGSVPKNFHPAVEKGLLDSIKKGVLAGYPVVGLKAVLVDGSYHAVDSSEMSFKMAAAIAYKNGLPQAAPTLLEPIGLLKAVVPDDNMGDIIGDINKRRGRVLGMNPMENRMQEIEADVPMAEMGDFSTIIRSVTQGRGSFSLEFQRYEDAPPMIAQKVIEEAKKAAEAE